MGWLAWQGHSLQTGPGGPARRAAAAGSAATLVWHGRDLLGGGRVRVTAPCLACGLTEPSASVLACPQVPLSSRRRAHSTPARRVASTRPETGAAASALAPSESLHTPHTPSHTRVPQHPSRVSSASRPRPKEPSFITRPKPASQNGNPAAGRGARARLRAQLLAEAGEAAAEGAEGFQLRVEAPAPVQPVQRLQRPPPPLPLLSNRARRHGPV
jgi:hypothetical protein